MINIDRWQEIWETVRRNKLRTVLTCLSVAWGIFMLVILMGAGTGLKNSAEYQFRDDAVNSLWMWRGRTSIPHKGTPVGQRTKFYNEDYAAVRDTLPGVEHITARFRMRGQRIVSYGSKKSSFDIRATHPAHKYLENTIITKGRFLNELDMKERRKVAVIGVNVKKHLFGREPALGKYIKIDRNLFRVVGIFEDIGGEGEQSKLYIPIDTAQALTGASREVHMMMFTIGDAGVAESQKIEENVRRMLAARRGFSPRDRRALRIRNNVERFNDINNLFLLIQAFIWVIGVGTIIAGIVGVSNIMLISVKERTKEIGLRKAVGATPRSIIGLVMQEALTITAIAGYCGMIAGILVIEAINKYMPPNDYLRNPEVDLGVVIYATILLVIAGALAGFFPAWRASKVSPVVALRDE